MLVVFIVGLYYGVTYVQKFTPRVRVTDEGIEVERNDQKKVMKWRDISTIRLSEAYRKCGKKIRMEIVLEKENGLRETETFEIFAGEEADIFSNPAVQEKIRIHHITTNVAEYCKTRQSCSGKWAMFLFASIVCIIGLILVGKPENLISAMGELRYGERDFSVNLLKLVFTAWIVFYYSFGYRGSLLFLSLQQIKRDISLSRVIS